MTTIGYWYSEYEPEYPVPRESRNPNQGNDLADKLETIEKNGKRRYLVHERHYKGSSDCRVCGCRNGSNEFTMGKFTWTGGLKHYLRAHNTEMPPEFYDLLAYAQEKNLL